MKGEKKIKKPSERILELLREELRKPPFPSDSLLHNIFIAIMRYLDEEYEKPKRNKIRF